MPFLKRNPFFLILLINSFVFPKTVDDELWTSIELKSEIASKIELEFEQQIRLKDHFSQFHKTFTDISLSYELNPLIEFSGKFRYIVYNDKEKTRIGLSCKIDPGNHYNLPSYKFRVQQDYDQDEQAEDIILRNKVTFKYPLTGMWVPFTSFEIFHTLDEEILIFDKYRFSLGFEYELSRNQALELFYIYKGKLDESEVDGTNIFALKYEYSL